MEKIAKKLPKFPKLEEINLINADFSKDPIRYIAPYYSAPQALFYNEMLGSWIAFKHDVCREILLSDKISNNRKYSAKYQNLALTEEQIPNLTKLMQNNYLYTGHEHHIDARKLVNKAFSLRSISSSSNFIQSTINKACQPLLKMKTVDVPKDVTPKIPFMVISQLIGIAPEDIEQTIEEMETMIRVLNPFNTTEDYLTIDESCGKITAYIYDLVIQRQHNLRDDLISDFIRAAESEEMDWVTADSIVYLLCGLISAGSTTVKASADILLHTLLTHKEQWQYLKDNPDEIDTVTKELLRFRSPAKILIRYAMDDFDIEGTKVCKGDTLMISCDGFSHDPAVFSHPEVLDFGRDDLSKSMSFGLGEHFCIGVHLAKAELHCFIQFFLEHLPNASLVDDCSWKDMEIWGHNIESMVINTGND